ncbi:MAG: hypothetical protein EDR02_11375 [Actinobacteria bacterium]|nr:MAG: hypothetical protein EDR02_11375 [Actinomycetota bacterium]RIK05286.1 MAG: hypothetical protein DCC48_10415 [Acidobacteriota bacterium]
MIPETPDDRPHEPNSEAFARLLDALVEQAFRSVDEVLEMPALVMYVHRDAAGDHDVRLHRPSIADLGASLAYSVFATVAGLIERPGPELWAVADLEGVIVTRHRGPSRSAFVIARPGGTWAEEEAHFIESLCTTIADVCLQLEVTSQPLAVPVPARVLVRRNEDTHGVPPGGGCFGAEVLVSLDGVQRSGNGSAATELAAVATAVAAAEGRGSEVRDAREVLVDDEPTMFVLVETVDGSMGVGCVASGSDALQAAASATQVALSAV